MAKKTIGTKASLIGAPKMRRTKSGWSHECELLYTGSAAECKTNIPEIGDEILDSWAPSSAASVVIAGVAQPKNEVVSCEVDWLGGLGAKSQWLWRLSIGMVGDSKGGGGSVNTPENLAKKIDSSYSTKEIHLDIEWWGLRKAEKDMIGTSGDPCKTDKMKIANANCTIDFFKTYAKAHATEWTDCVVGDFVFRNCDPEITIRKTSEESNGNLSSTDYTLSTLPTELACYADKFTKPAHRGLVNAYLSPYGTKKGVGQTDWDVDKGPSAANLYTAGQKCKVLVYNVEYYVKGKTAADALAFWAGISPLATQFGTGTKADLIAPKLASPHASNASAWKAVDQKVTEIRDTKGDVWAKVSRTMERAPFGWVWSISKSFHNYWAWGPNNTVS